MKAARFHGVGKPLTVEEVVDPRPSFGEVVVRIEACGICGTDVHIAVEGLFPTAFVPITLGHEGAGIVHEVGEGVTGWGAGDRVGIYPSIACGRCALCLSGKDYLCPQSRIFGIFMDGCFAEYIAVPEGNLFRLPDFVSFESGALLSDAVSAAFHAVYERAGIRGGESVAVFGCGGLGYHGVMFARALGAGMIIAVDIKDELIARAREVGADVGINPAKEDLGDRIRELTGSDGVDVALEFVGTRDTIVSAMKALKRGGKLVVVGIGMEKVDLPPIRVFVGKELSVLGSMGYAKGEMEKIFSLIREKKVDLSRSVSARYPLEEINEGMLRMAKKEGNPIRLVVTPGAGARREGAKSP
jgi:D-arabinose 1-dehydrogenase-like Zn-dependent alcohol dehydrogenase